MHCILALIPGFLIHEEEEDGPGPILNKTNHIRGDHE